MNDQQRSRHQQILSLLKNRGFTTNNPLHAAELDLERKVLENEGLSPPFQYRVFHF